MAIGAFAGSDSAERKPGAASWFLPRLLTIEQSGLETASTTAAKTAARTASAAKA